MKGFHELLEKDLDNLFVTCELFWTGIIFSQMIVQFVERRFSDDEELEILRGHLGYVIFEASGKKVNYP